MSETSIIGDIELKLDKSLKLLYHAIDEVSVEDFHTKCDGKGPTVTILYGKYNRIFGGYTSESWSSDGNKTKRDEDAFLFHKYDNDEAVCIFMPIKEKNVDKAITCDAKFGPTFGARKYDLQTFVEEKGKPTTEIKDGYIHLNGSIHFGKAYDIEEKDKDKSKEIDKKSTIKKGTEETAGVHSTGRIDIDQGALIVKRIEVYQVVAGQLSEPWRKKPTKEETSDMRKSLEKLEPVQGLDLKYYNILLIGVIGSGKSSFYNTIATVLAGSVKNPAPARNAPTSVTNKLHAYVLKTKDGNPMNLRMFDIRGFEENRGYEHELMLILDGKLPIGYEFPDNSTQVKDELLNMNARLKDEMHLVCFVTGTHNSDTFTDKLRIGIEKTKTTINKKGLPMVVVATKFDELCKKISEDADRVYSSFKARDAVKKISDFFGVERSHIFPVVNYVNVDQIKDGMDRLALQALTSMARLITDNLENHPDFVRNADGWTDRAAKIPNNKKGREDLLTKMTELGDKRLRVLCVGAVNSGKTSFIDSVSSALNERIISKASGGLAEGGDSGESKTEMFQMYRMRYKHKEDIKESNVFIGDTPGFQQKEGVKLEDIYSVILGEVKNKCKMTNQIKSSKKTEARKENRIHCVCLVYDISVSPTALSENIQQPLQQLQRWLNEKGIPIVVVLTKGDLVSDSVKDCKLNVFENNTIKENKNKLIERFRFRQNKLYPVINYIHEDRVVPASDKLIFEVLREILSLGIENLRDIEGDSDDEDDDDCGEREEA